MPSRFALPHIDITGLSVGRAYVGTSTGGVGTQRIRDEHGRRLRSELDAALRAGDEARPEDPRLERLPGTFIEVELTKGTKPDALDLKREEIKSSAAKVDDDNARTIALYVPDHARAALSSILDDYLTGAVSEKTGLPPNAAKVNAIEAFRLARLETFWTDDRTKLPEAPNDVIWWALWCWAGGENAVDEVCQRLNVRVADRDRRLYFPEIVVIPALASRPTIELMLFATGAIAELRRASDNPVFFTDDVQGEQQAWVDGLAERVLWPAGDAPAVCLFDTGVNRGHSLIEPALTPGDMQAVNAAWGTDDHDGAGHGTGMAGLALHGDLTAALADQSERRLSHRLESVKLLPPQPFDAADPHSYGSITQAAIALPEITAPERQRVFCMAVTNDNVSGGTPSAWSAALDQAAAGSMIGDGEDADKRLIIVSAGNIPPHIEFDRILPPGDYPIEDPAQAWNALTVGGYTDFNQVRDKGYQDWSTLVRAGELSPHSRTSIAWPHNAPFKPELVLEAGNRAVSPGRTEVLTTSSLSLLTTGRAAAEPLVSFEATSAATAQAARMAAQIMADHPEFWPETVRALMVHSAEWTQPMLAEFGALPGKRDRYSLIRKFGYGVPNYERATASAENSLALFAQAEIQPFSAEGGRKFGECHYYSLPFPPEMLEQLENETVELKVTLSYFVDPNPGLSANIDPQRYQSHGLRFDLRRKGESIDTFKKRVNANERENARMAPRAEADDDRWMLGPQSVSAGSLHCDVWRGPAIELLGRNRLCIKPVMGWGRGRASKEICNAKRRYALVVTLKTQNVDLSIYTPIVNTIRLGIDINIDI